MKQTFKRIPFDIELAKKITKGKKKGRILTQEGKKVRIVCWDKKPISKDSLDFPIVAIIENDYNGEMLHTYTKEGSACYPNYKSRYNLIIEILTCQKDYSNFKPCKWQPCLVRDCKNNKWIIQVCAGKDNKGNILFYTQSGTITSYQHYIPLCKATKQLVGTTKGFEEFNKN